MVALKQTHGLALGLFAALLVGGCASSSAPTQELSVPAERRHAFETPRAPSPASLRIVRDVGMAGGSSYIHVSIDGKKVAAIDKGEAIQVDLEPGEHQISAIETDWLNQRKPTLAEFIARPGQRIVYRLGFSEGRMLVQRDMSAER